jgi:hypothetical protein
LIGQNSQDSALRILTLSAARSAGDHGAVHTLFLVVAYVLMLRGSDERPLRRLWDDIAPAFVSCLGLAAVAVPASFALTAAHVTAILWLAALGAVAVPPYLLTLRVCFPAAWRSQRSIMTRILPGRLRRRGAKRHMAAAQRHMAAARRHLAAARMRFSG